MRRLVIALAVLAGLGVLAGVALRAVLSSTWMRERIEREAGSALAMPVEIAGPISPSLWPPGLGASEIRLGSGDSPLARIGKLVVRVGLRSWLGGELHLRAVSVRHVRITLEPREDDAAIGDELSGLLAALPDALRASDIAVEVRTPGEESVELRIDQVRLGRCGDPFELRGAVLGVPLALAGRLGCPGGAALALTDFEARIRDSELRGALTVELRDPRPRVEGAVGGRLALADLLPVDDSGEEVNPLDAPLGVELLDALDAKIAFALDEFRVADHTLVRPRGELVVARQALRLVIAESVFWEGALAAKLDVEAGSRPPRVALEAMADDLHVQAVRGADASGNFDFEVDVRGSGATPRALLATLDGRVRVVMEPTVYNEKPLGPLGRDLFAILFEQMAGGGEDVLDCAVTLLAFEDGIGKAGVLLDTPDVTVAGTGVVDLRQLVAEIVLRPAPKNPSVGALTAPIRIHGPIDDLRAGLEYKGVAMDTGYVVLLGVVFPPLAVVPLLDPGTGERNACEAALEAADPEIFRARGHWGRSVDAIRAGSDWLRNLVRGPSR